MTEPPAPPPISAGPRPLRPHRGGMILALGILSIVLCFVLGIIAWVMANGDLREMDAGTMDPSGRGVVQAGKICGIVSVVLWLGGIALYVLFFVVMAGLLAAGVAAGA